MRERPALDFDRTEPKNIFCVERLENLLLLCRYLSDDGYTGDSSAYKDVEQDMYYLLATEGTLRPSTLPRFPCLREFAFLTMNFTYLIRIIERCRPICDKNAVEILGKLA